MIRNLQRQETSVRDSGCQSQKVFHATITDKRAVLGFFR